MSDIPVGFCQCGCGQRTKISFYNDKHNGYVKGVPRRFIKNHQAFKCEPYHKTKQNHGYIVVLVRNHPRAHNGYVLEHIVIVEQILGGPLPNGACVHHIDGNKANNNHNNLVICENKAYHYLLHKRQKALEICGQANWRKCDICGEYDAPDNLYIAPGRYHGRHRNCFNEYQRRLKNERQSF